MASMVIFKIDKIKKPANESKLNNPIFSQEKKEPQNYSSLQKSNMNMCNGAFKRELWTEKEDQILRELYDGLEAATEVDWNDLALKMTNDYGCKHRVGKQLRERWVNHLDPGVVKDYWSQQEEAVLFKKQKEFGNKWSEISKCLPGRTDNSVKNYFYSKLRRQVRFLVKLLSKGKLLELNELDENKYEPNFVYKLIKDIKMPYQDVCKSKVLEVLLKHKNGDYLPVRKSKKSLKRLENIIYPSSKNNSYVNADSKDESNTNTIQQNEGNQEKRDKSVFNSTISNITYGINSKTKFSIKRATNSENLPEDQLAKKRRKSHFDENDESKKKKMSKREIKARKFHHTDIKIVILKKVFENDEYDYEELDYDNQQRQKVEDIYEDYESHEQKNYRSHNYSFCSNNNIQNKDQKNDSLKGFDSNASEGAENSNISPTSKIANKRKTLKPLIIENSDDEEDNKNLVKPGYTNAMNYNKPTVNTVTTKSFPKSFAHNGFGGYEINSNFFKNEVITPNNRANTFAPIISPLNNNFGIIQNNIQASNLSYNFENFFKNEFSQNPTNISKYDMKNLEKSQAMHNSNSKLSNKEESGNKEGTQPLKPTARKGLSLDIDEINKSETNNFFNPQTKGQELINSLIQAHNASLGENKDIYNSMTPKKEVTKTLGISPSSAFGKANIFKK